MQTSEKTEKERLGAEILLDVVNTFVVKSKRIDVEVEIHYDLSLPDAWDDKCRLWTAADDGATYSESVQLTDGVKVICEGSKVQIRFSDVLVNKVYSCLIDQGDDATILVFENMTITPDMAA